MSRSSRRAKAVLLSAALMSAGLLSGCVVTGSAQVELTVPVGPERAVGSPSVPPWPETEGPQAVEFIEDE